MCKIPVMQYHTRFVSRQAACALITVPDMTGWWQYAWLYNFLSISFLVNLTPTNRGSNGFELMRQAYINLEAHLRPHKAILLEFLFSFNFDYTVAQIM